MQSICIEGTAASPTINFNSNGSLLIQGRSLPEDVNKLYNPLIEFVGTLDVPSVLFNVNLDYFNTATSKKLMDLFRTLDANNNVGQVKINWYFEEGDDDSVEMAEIYEDMMLKTTFVYHEYAEEQEPELEEA